METNNKTIGTVIAQIRQEQGLTHDDIAERALVTVLDMQNIEEGTLSLDQKTLDSIARVLGISSEKITERARSPLAIIKKTA